MVLKLMLSAGENDNRDINNKWEYEEEDSIVENNDWVLLLVGIVSSPIFLIDTMFKFHFKKCNMKLMFSTLIG